MWSLFSLINVTFWKTFFDLLGLYFVDPGKKKFFVDCVFQYKKYYKKKILHKQMEGKSKTRKFEVSND